MKAGALAAFTPSSKLPTLTINPCPYGQHPGEHEAPQISRAQTQPVKAFFIDFYPENYDQDERTNPQGQIEEHSRHSRTI